jgi:hypothetical protein
MQLEVGKLEGTQRGRRFNNKTKKNSKTTAEEKETEECHFSDKADLSISNIASIGYLAEIRFKYQKEDFDSRFDVNIEHPPTTLI